MCIIIINLSCKKIILPIAAFAEFHKSLTASSDHKKKKSLLGGNMYAQ